VEGRTAIHWAAIKCNLDLVCLLLDLNVNVSTHDQYGLTALMLAMSHHIVQDDKIPILQMLLEQMDTVNKKLIDLQDVEGYTALHESAESTEKVIHELLNYAPNLFCQTSDTSSTALHLCLLSLRDEWIRLRNLRCMVEHANGYGLNGLNIQDNQGCTVLHLALEDVDSNKFVIDYVSTKADVSIQDVEGNTPLDIAAECRDSEMVLMLLRSPHATEAADTHNGL